jgi:hypothetical protein
MKGVSGRLDLRRRSFGPDRPEDRDSGTRSRGQPLGGNDCDRQLLDVLAANLIRPILTSPNLPLRGAQRRTRTDSPIASTDGLPTTPRADVRTKQRYDSRLNSIPRTMDTRVLITVR